MNDSVSRSWSKTIYNHTLNSEATGLDPATTNQEVVEKRVVRFVDVSPEKVKETRTVRFVGTEERRVCERSPRKTPAKPRTNVLKLGSTASASTAQTVSRQILFVTPPQSPSLPDTPPASPAPAALPPAPAPEPEVIDLVEDREDLKTPDILFEIISSEDEEQEEEEESELIIVKVETVKQT